MARLLDTLRRRSDARLPERDGMSLDSFYEQVKFAAQNYLLLGGGVSGNSEAIGDGFTSYIAGAYKANGIVFGIMLARLMLFSEARLQFQRMRSGRPGDLFGTQDLAIFEKPWPNGTTGELLARMIQDADQAGNFFGYRETRTRLRRLRPDWVEIILTGDPAETIDSDVAGYLYHPGGKGGRGEPKLILPPNMVHWSPHPDPEASYRGMSWFTPVLREIQGDRLATAHKNKFFENGATLQSIVSLKESVTEEQFKTFVRIFNEAHQGVENAYRNLVVGGGADVTLVGADMHQLDFRATQGAGEVRIATAGGIHPVILGIQEGLNGSSLNQGNFAAARRLTADKTLRPLWRMACAALSNVIEVPADARLWYDDRDIPFLREDRSDLAQIQAAEAAVIRQLVDGGWEPESVKTAVLNQDWSLLRHTGLLSVQLQEPLTGPPPSGNGSANGKPAQVPAGVGA